MMHTDPQFVNYLQNIVEVLGTMAFAMSGIRHAAAKKYDWFGGFVCGVAVAIGGGTIRDLMLGQTPFWMTTPLFLLCTFFAQFITIAFAKLMKRLDNAWFVFDTFGLALFTIAGIQKTLACGFPFWVAIIMGCITGAAGGVIRDVLLNKEPVIFQKEIYAMASIAGGFLYWGMMALGINLALTLLAVFAFVCATRFLAVKYHISLPLLRFEE